MVSLLMGESYAQPTDLLLDDPEDIDVLLEEMDDSPVLREEKPASSSSQNTSSKSRVSKKSSKKKAEKEDNLDDELEELGFVEEENTDDQKLDDLDSLREDIGEIEFNLPEEEEKVAKDAEKEENSTKAKKKKKKIKIVKDGNITSQDDKAIFEIGRLEKELHIMAKKMQGKIPDTEWNEIAGSSTSGTYEVQSGDWLWKISKKIFGSGFYYSKIWALNSYITNPHEIEPGMVLAFTTGSASNLPDVNIVNARIKNLGDTVDGIDEYSQWGDEAKPSWITEREKLKNSGVYLQYSTGDTKEDLELIGKQSLVKEYELYEPPKLDFLIGAPEDQYGKDGFNKNSIIAFNYKEGFDVNTFISSNIVQDFGKIESAIDNKVVFSSYDRVFVRFDDGVDVVVGDKFSVYVGTGERSHKHSDRKGFQYIITAGVEVLQKHKDLWECRILDNIEPVRRGDRITVYTPKINRITQTFNSRLIESVIMSHYYDKKSSASFGDIVYLDRGRADGVDIGNIFEIYGFEDRGTKKNITGNPIYKTGELAVINVTDNFSTALITQSTMDFSIGDIAITKTKEAAARSMKVKNKLLTSDSKRMMEKSVDELDVELNLDDLNDSLLDKADKIQFTEDELAELERQEKEKSIITENEKDLRALERLESELETAEKMLNEARLDEDKLLEDQDLNKVESDFGVSEQESLDELEENFGKRYLDEDLNDKENPFGLTEFDVEEVDELLNTMKEEEQQ